MTASSRAILLLLLLGGSARAAETGLAPLAHAAPALVSFSLSSRAGLALAPFVTTAFPEVSGFATVLTGAASVRVSLLGRLHVRLPMSLARLDFPAGVQVGEAALGNLELGLQHPIEGPRSTRLELLAAWIAPSAEHGTRGALVAHRALALGSALSGARDASLLTPGVSGLRLSASAAHGQGPFELRLSLDLPVLVRVSDASLPGETVTHPIGIVPAIDSRADWQITSWFVASFGAGLIAELARVQEPALERDRERRLQVILEPGVSVRLCQELALGVDATAPVGGNLGGDAWSIAVHARFVPGL